MSHYDGRELAAYHKALEQEHLCAVCGNTAHTLRTGDWLCNNHAWERMVTS